MEQEDASPGGIWGIAVDSSNIYFTSRGDSAGNPNSGRVLQMPVTGTAVTTLASGLNQSNFIVTNSTAVFWTNADSVMSVPIGGTTVTTLASNQTGVYGLAIDGNSVYWATNAVNNCGVDKAPLVGGGTPVLLGSDPACARPYGVAIDGTYVYWTDNASGLVMKVALSGGAPVTMASGVAGPLGIAVDSSAVYWVTADPACTAPCLTSSVMKIAK